MGGSGESRLGRDDDGQVLGEGPISNLGVDRKPKPTEVRDDDKRGCRPSDAHVPMRLRGGGSDDDDDGGGREGDDRDRDDDGIQSRPLYHPSDADRLSEMICLVRAQIEAFAVPPVGCGDFRFRRMAGKIDVGRVGLRCARCAGSRRRPRPRRDDGGDGDAATSPSPFKPRPVVSRNNAVSYPRSIKHVCQAARDWHRFHLMGCPEIPDDVKARYRRLKASPGKGTKPRSGAYWEERCRAMGMIDTAEGIRLRGGNFADDGDGDNENEPIGTKTCWSEEEELSAGGSTASASVSISTAEQLEAKQTVSASEKNVDALVASVGPVSLRQGTSKTEKSQGQATTMTSVSSTACDPQEPNITEVKMKGGGSVLPSSPELRQTSSEVNIPTTPPLTCPDESVPTAPSDPSALDASINLAAQRLEQMKQELHILTQAAPRWEQQQRRDGDGGGGALLPRPHESEPLSSPATEDAPNTFPPSAPPPEIGRDTLLLKVQHPGDPTTTVAHEHESSGQSSSRWETSFVEVEAKDSSSCRSGDQYALDDIDTSTIDRDDDEIPSPENEPEQPAAAAGDWAAGKNNDAPIGGRVLLREKSTCSSISLEAGVGSPLTTTTTTTTILAPSPATIVDSAALLDMVKCARSLVQTVREMAGGEGVSASSYRDLDGSREEEEENVAEAEEQAAARREGLVGLGVELYELFSGRRPFDSSGGEVSETASDLSAAPPSLDGRDDSCPSSREQQPRKRGKQATKAHSRSSHREYVPLLELGIPSSAISTLVSSLLDGALDTAESSANEGGNCYNSIEEVEEDLGLVVANPGKYLGERSTILPDESSPRRDALRENLYGRESELSTLYEAYRRAAARREIVLLSGYSGSGKTAIARSFQKTLAGRGARFVTGKFDSMRQVQPLSAITSAFDGYFAQLSRDATLSIELRPALTKALGGEAKVLIDLIPSLNLFVTATDQTSARIDGRQARQRLYFLFRVLFRTLCGHGGPPLVLLLDDLQWSDELSLDLLRVLVTDVRIEGLLFIGTYRDNEVGPGHPLAACLEDIQRSEGTQVTSVGVGKLDRDSVSTLLSDAFHVLPRRTVGLAETILHKTGGNALFVSQFLQSLHDTGLLQFSLSTRCWEWDLDMIRDTKIADNIVAFLTDKLLALSREAQRALIMVAVFGSKCHETVLGILERGGLLRVSQLGVAIAEGLVEKAEQTYSFHHDNIQLAAFQLVAESDREKFHLEIGRMLWKLASSQELEDLLFVVVDQLTRGSRLMSDHDERTKFADLLLTAGKRAIAMSAFSPALVYLKAGISMIDEKDWSNRETRGLCLGLYSSCAEVEYIQGEFTSMGSHLEIVFMRSSVLAEKLEAYSTLVQSLTAQRNIDGALDTAIKVLRELGEPLPPKLTHETVQGEVIKTHKMLVGVEMDSLLKMRTLQHPDKLEAMKLLSILVFPTFAARKDYFALVACRLVQLSISYGVCKESAQGFACFAVILCANGQINSGYRLGKIALSTLERFQAKECVARLYCAVYGFVCCWVEPMQACLPSHKYAIDMGLSLGDTENAMLNAHVYTGTALQTGQPLGPLIDEMMVYSEQMQEYNPLVYTLNKPTRQMALNLAGKSENPIKLVGAEMDEVSLLANASAAHTLLSSTTYFYRMWLELLFGEYHLAAETALMNADVEKNNTSRAPLVTNHAFYYGLTALALARKEGEQKWIDVINKTMKQMGEWVEISSWNFQNKLELLKAEYAFLVGDSAAAAGLYDRAAELASEHRFTHEEALALEKTGMFYLESGDHGTASGYFVKARDCYAKWGAFSKVEHIQGYYL